MTNEKPTQNNSNCLPTVLDLIKWTRDVERFSVILLISGCGSRKSMLVDNIVSGTIEGIPHYTTLEIQSRASKRQEILNGEADYSGYISQESNLYFDNKTDLYMYKIFGAVPEKYLQYYDQNSGKYIQDACVIPIQTDSFLIDASLADPKNLDGMIDAIWKQYDLIVVDEIHSLLLDSGYMVSQARIGELIKRFAYRCKDKNKHMILMTATAQGVEDLLRQWIPNIHVLNYSKKAYSVMPKLVRVTAKECVAEGLRMLYSENVKFIYFYNGQAKYLSEICREYELRDDGVSLFSDIEMRNNLKRIDPEQYEKMIEVENYLAEHRRFPEWVRYVFSTSKNREGISIENSDFKHMYVDSHIPTEVIQYAGRLRYADFTLTIVDGSFQYFMGTVEELKNQQKSDREYIEELNKKFNELKTDEEKKKLIKDIENMYLSSGTAKVENPNYRPYIFYNPFSHKFEINQVKIEGEIYRAECIRNWNSLNRKSRTSFSSYIRSWWDKPIDVAPYETKEWKSRYLFSVNNIFPNNGSYETPRYYNDKTIEKLRKELAQIWGINYSRINTYLNGFYKEARFKKIQRGSHKGKWELLLVEKDQEKSE